MASTKPQVKNLTPKSPEDVRGGFFGSLVRKLGKKASSGVKK